MSLLVIFVMSPVDYLYSGLKDKRGKQFIQRFFRCIWSNIK